MSNTPNCPKCQSAYTYEDGDLYICPECAYEWSVNGGTETSEEQKIVKDANGNVLQDGDTVTIIKDLKVINLPVSCEIEEHPGVAMAFE